MAPRIATVADLIEEGTIAPPLDGNHGSIHPKVTDYVASGIPFIMASDLKNGQIDTRNCAFIPKEISNKLRKGFAIEGDVIISHKATIGRSAIVGEINTPYIVLTPQLTYYRVINENILNRRYLYYYFNSRGFLSILEQWAGAGSTRAYLGITAQKRLPIVIPDILVQEKIAAVLGSLDDKIELNRRMNETLEAMAQAVFRDWFVDFGPTRRKQEGEIDPVAILSGLIPDPARAADIAALFPATFGDNGLPEGWEGSQLSQISTLNPESWSARKHPSRVNYVDLANTKWGTIETVSSMSWEDAPSRARRVLRAGDTIVGTVRPGNGSFAFVSEEELTGSTGFAALRPTHKWYAELIYCAATASENIKRLASLADGGAYPAVRPDVVSETEISTSDERLAKAFSFLSAPLFALIEKNKIQNLTLAATRDLLLPKLMSGEFRVQGVDRLGEVD